jgi:hypothetical protein
VRPWQGHSVRWAAYRGERRWLAACGGVQGQLVLCEVAWAVGTMWGQLGLRWRCLAPREVVWGFLAGIGGTWGLCTGVQGVGVGARGCGVCAWTICGLCVVSGL